MPEEPRLRVVAGPPKPPEKPVPESPPDRRLTVALAVALVITLALLLWSRNQLGAEIAGLESQVRELEAEVAVREQAIAAHERRLDDVRTQVRELVDLVERPVSAPR